MFSIVNIANWELTNRLQILGTNSDFNCFYRNGVFVMNRWECKMVDLCGHLKIWCLNKYQLIGFNLISFL